MFRAAQLVETTEHRHEGACIAATIQKPEPAYEAVSLLP